MKKILQILGLLLIFPIIVLADGVENYYINATIEQDGSLLVEEYFTITGYYNGYERIIDYKNLSATPFNINASSYGGSTLHNGSGLEILKIGGADHYFNGNFSNLNVDAFNYDSGAEKGDYGVYDYDTTSTGKDIMIYNPSKKNKSFYLKYRLNNMAIIFNDVGELGWNVIGNAFREDIENLVITLNIPGNNAEVKAWAHGPLNGLINIDSKEKVTFTVKNLSAYTAIDIRSTFSPSIIINSSKKYDTNALDKILAYEEKKAEEANELRRQNEANNEKKALNLLTTFKNDITRKNYENAYAAIDILMEGDTKSNYLEELKIYKEQLDTIEEKTAVKYLDELENDLNMGNYDKTYAAILVLDNETKKETLTSRLNTIYIKLEAKEKKDDNIRLTVSIVLILYVVYLCTLIYKKYKKDPEVEFNNEYFREIPDDSTPEDVSYLFSRNITDKATSAAIMDLIRRKVITQEKIDSKNYRLLLNSTIEVSDKDSKLLKVIFGSKTEITTKEMKRNASISYNSVVSNYNDYKNLALNEAISKEYYEDNISKNKDNKLNININDVSKGIIIANLLIIALVSILMSFYLLGANLMYKKAAFGYLVLLLFVICVSTWFAIPSKKTYNGALAFKKWKALEKFLKDFGSFADKEVPEIALWEKYLVYATLFGCAKEVSKVMDMRFKEYNMSSESYYDSWVTNYYINDLISTAVRTSIASAQSAKYASESSSSSGSWSSGSGGGGGFSSGGGSFGGGGGGGRF